MANGFWLYGSITWTGHTRPYDSTTGGKRSCDHARNSQLLCSDFLRFGGPLEISSDILSTPLDFSYHFLTPPSLGVRFY